MSRQVRDTRCDVQKWVPGEPRGTRDPIGTALCAAQGELSIFGLGDRELTLGVLPSLVLLRSPIAKAVQSGTDVGDQALGVVCAAR